MKLNFVVRENVEDAINYVKEAVNLEPRFGNSHWYASLVYMVAGEYELSWESMQNARNVGYDWENNINDLKINPDYPVLNYQSDLVNELLDSGKIKKENIYNLPSIIKKSGSKTEFHKLVGDHANVPQTVFTKNDALKLKLPVIAKPASKHSGLGIKVFNNKEELNSAKESDFDTYSEFVDKAAEHRSFFRARPDF